MKPRNIVLFFFIVFILLFHPYNGYGDDNAVDKGKEQENKIGVVLDVDGGMVTLSLGREEGVEKGDIFSIYSLTRVVKLPLSGEVVLKKEKEIGKLKVVDVYAHDAIAEVLIMSENETAKKGMTVIQIIEGMVENEGPIIVSITPEVNQIEGGQGIGITVKAFDKEGDSFSFQWVADKGRLALNATTLMANKWIAPLEQCESIITVIAIDKWGNKSERSLTLKSKGTMSGSRKDFSIYRKLGNDVTQAGNLLYNNIKFNNNGDLFVNDMDKDGIFKHFLDIPYGPTKVSTYKENNKERTLETPYCFDVTENRIYICDGNDGFIRVFAKDGYFIKTIGSGENSEIGYLDDPSDIDVAEDGTIYITDKGNRCIEVYNSDGSSRLRAGKRGREKGEILLPVGVEIGSDGTIYILDAERTCVIAYTSNMEYKSHFQCQVTKRSILTDMAIDVVNKRIYVLDKGEEYVVGYSTKGEVLGFMNEDKDSWQHVRRPASIAVSPIGQVYIGSARFYQLAKYNVDGSFAGKQDRTFFNRIISICANGRNIFLLEKKYYQIYVFDYEGWCIAIAGGNSKKNGTIGRAVKIVASDDFIYALDTYYYNVHKYSVAGEELAQLGDKGKEPGKYLEPVDIATNRKGDLFVLDQDILRVSIFNSAGDFVNSFESDPNASINMDEPALIAVSQDGKSIFIYDRDLYTILKYNNKGVAQSFYGQKGAKKIGEFYYVDYIGVDEAGYLLITESRYDRIQKIDFTGPSGVPFVQFYKDTVIYKDGELYAVDPFGQLIVYDEEGTLVLMR